MKYKDALNINLRESIGVKVKGEKKQKNIAFFGDLAEEGIHFPF